MASFADLHIHSCASSDGEFSARELVDQCVTQGVECFSVTDHNSVKSVGEAAVLAAESGLRFISGIEIDCTFEGVDLHLLGYGINWQSKDFGVLEERVFSAVMESFDEWIDNLQKLGFAIDAPSVLAAANGKLPTGELIAEVLLSDKERHTPPLMPYFTGGARADMPYLNFYLDYLAQGRPAFVPIPYIDYREALEIIGDNGGVAVVAHPGLNFNGRERVVEQLLARGAAGLEVFNNYHSEQQRDYFAHLVQQRALLMTCGSDFHGKTKPRIRIGQFKSDCRFEAYCHRAVEQLFAAAKR